MTETTDEMHKYGPHVDMPSWASTEPTPPHRDVDRDLRLECLRLAVKWTKGGLGSKDTIDAAKQFEHYARTGDNPIPEKPLDTTEPLA